MMNKHGAWCDVNKKPIYFPLTIHLKEVSIMRPIPGTKPNARGRRLLRAIPPIDFFWTFTCKSGLAWKMRHFADRIRIGPEYSIVRLHIHFWS